PGREPPPRPEGAAGAARFLRHPDARDLPSRMWTQRPRGRGWAYTRAAPAPSSNGSRHQVFNLGTGVRFPPGPSLERTRALARDAFPGEGSGGSGGASDRPHRGLARRGQVDDVAGSGLTGAPIAWK